MFPTFFTNDMYHHSRRTILCLAASFVRITAFTHPCVALFRPNYAMLVDALLQKLRGDLRADLERTVTSFVATARTQLEGVLAEVAKERAKGLAEVTKEKADLHREIAAMHKHKEAQEGRVVMDLGGHRYTTSVQTLRLPAHFFRCVLQRALCHGPLRRRQHLHRP
jgi:hypothetical protein